MALITEGSHKAQVIDFGLGELENENRTPFVGLLFRICDDEPDAGRTIQHQLFLTDKAAEYTIAALRRCGWTGNDISEFESSELYPCDQLLPNAVSIVIEHQEDRGKTYAKVAFVNSPERTTVSIKSRVEGRLAKNFGVRLKSLCASIPARGPARNQPQRPLQPSNPSQPLPLSDNNGDDFPF